MSVNHCFVFDDCSELPDSHVSKYKASSKRLFLYIGPPAKQLSPAGDTTAPYGASAERTGQRYEEKLNDARKRYKIIL